MAESRTNLLQGTLDLLILKSLALGALHGLGVSRRIEQITKGTFQVKPGSLFPALHRMEEAGWLSASWGESENNRRAKYYRLTKAGRRQLGAETEQWERISAGIVSALEASKEAILCPYCRVFPVFGETSFTRSMSSANWTTKCAPT